MQTRRWLQPELRAGSAGCVSGARKEGRARDKKDTKAEEDSGSETQERSKRREREKREERENSDSLNLHNERHCRQ